MTKTFFLSLLGAFLATVVYSQQPESSDSVDASSNKAPRQDFFRVDLTWDYLTGLPDDVKQQWYGRGVSLGLLFDQPFNSNGTISGALGAGFSSHNYYLNSVVTRITEETGNFSQFTVVGDTILDRGKISINYVDIPFELRFRTKPNDKGFRWKFAVGGRVGYLINVHEKLINRDNIKIKTYNYPDVTQWRYGASARFGYGSIMVSAFYSISPFFEPTNSKTQQNSFSIGISLVPF